MEGKTDSPLNVPRLKKKKKLGENNLNRLLQKKKKKKLMKVQTWVGRTFLVPFTGAIAINSSGCVATACSTEPHSMVALSRQSEANYK